MRSVTKPAASAADTTIQTGFRLPSQLLKSLDKHVEKLNIAQPGMSLTRSDIVRMALFAYLERKPAGR